MSGELVHLTPRIETERDEYYGEVCTGETNLRCVYALLNVIRGETGRTVASAGPGKCDDCGQEWSVRGVYGRFELCRRCMRLRANAGARLESEAAALDAGKRRAA